MKFEFFDSNPRRTLEPDLQSSVRAARRLDAAVAFVTRPGVALVREFLKNRPAAKARLIASVRFPTDLQELARLADEFPETVYLHLGFTSPREPRADRAQFHSKVVLLDLEGDERCAVIGSHNWTQCGLEGLNLEAGVIIRGHQSEPLFGQVREHIDACAAESERFERQRLRFYEASQRALHVGPGNQEGKDFPGFATFNSLVIHAEDGMAAGMPPRMQLFLPVREPQGASMFTTNRRVSVYIYPPGTLFGHRPPKATPREFIGKVTMGNDMSDAAVDRRAANCQIGDLRRPTVEALPEGTVPTPTGELSQVVVLLDGHGEAELPVFHSALQSPKMKLDVESDTMDLRDDLADAISEQRAPPAVMFAMPQRLALRTILRVPSKWLYPERILNRLKFVLHGSDNFDRSMIPLLDCEPPRSDNLLNDYVYQVYWRITEETIARIERQLKLIPDS